MIDIIVTFLAFAIIHITVARWFKELCTRSFGETFMRVWYRFLYTMVSGVTTAIAVYFIAQLPDRVLWNAPSWLRWLLHGIPIAAFVFGVQVFQYLDKWEFLGFRQVWRYLAKGEVAGNVEGLTDRELVTNGVYGIVRHPLYVAGIIIFTFSPNFTVNGVAITVLADLYFIFGMFIEERRFLKIFGEQYREYMKKVPMTMIVVTQEMRFARRAGSRVLFFHEGQIAEEGPPEQIFTNPQTENLRTFIQSIL